MRDRHRMTRAEFLRYSVRAAGGAALLSSSLKDLFALDIRHGAGSIKLGGRTPDTVLINGTIATMDPLSSTAQALAVRDGKIQQLGTTAQIQALADNETIVVDLKGRTVTPGFIDTHCHYQFMGMMGNYWLAFIPPEVTTIAEFQDALSAVVSELEENEWVNGYYLIFSDGRWPDKYDLDAVSPDNPVFVMHQGGHWATVNSRALEMAGISSATPDPTGGIIEKDNSGEPTGLLYNHRAMDLVRRLIPAYGSEDIRASILYAQPLFAAAGLTGFHDNNIRDPDAIQVYQQLTTQARVLQRQGLFYTLEWPNDLERALGISSITNDYTRMGGFKFLIDGQGPTFYTHEPHDGETWDMSTWEAQTFKDTVLTLHETGLQICVHCGGDAAMDLALDAFENAMNVSPRSDPRHRIEHGVISTQAATSRMRDLGVIVSTQPQFLRLAGDLYAGIFSEDQINRIIMTREWMDHGVTVSLGSDTPTTLWYEPRATIYGAMTRVTMSDQVMGADQILTAAEAIRAHTFNAAYALHQEGSLGSLEAGKLADLVVWEVDPLSATPEEVFRSAIDLTMVGGEIVYLGPRSPRRHLGA